MGIDVDVFFNIFIILFRISKWDDWVELKNVFLLVGKVIVKYFGIDKISVIF